MTTGSYVGGPVEVVGQPLGGVVENHPLRHRPEVGQFGSPGAERSGVQHLFLEGRGELVDVRSKPLGISTKIVEIIVRLVKVRISFKRLLRYLLTKTYCTTGDFKRFVRSCQIVF